MHAAIWLRDRVRRPTPFAILACAWLAMVLYANPGYLSYDSVQALAEARVGRYLDLAALVWRVVDHVVPGPFGMLLLQVTGVLCGAYRVLRSCLSPRRAAVCAGLVLWCPSISGTLGVIWTESHAAAWLLLGAGGLLSARRGLRIAGLVALALGAAMVVGGPVIVIPLVLGLWTWRPTPGLGEAPGAGAQARHASGAGRDVPRGGVRARVTAVAACALTSLVAAALASRFTDARAVDRARIDLVGTIHHAAPQPDAALAPAFATRPPGGLDAALRAAYDPTWSLDQLRAAAARTLGSPSPALTETRDAVVSSHRGAFFAYRWELLGALLQWSHRPAGSQVYVWFTDVQDLSGSAGLLQHDARPSALQRILQRGMTWLGTTWLFAPYLYAVLALALFPLALRDRVARAVLGSGLASLLVTFYAGTDAHLRGSLWLVVTTVLATALLIARRASRPGTAAIRSSGGAPA